MSQAMQIEFHSGELTVRKCSIADLEPLLDMLDTLLGNDYFFRRKHMEGMLTRPKTKVLSIHHNGETCGVMILYADTVLHNLYLTPSHRGMGIGTALLKTFRPAVVRAKGNMSAGDPVPFYNNAGYQVDGVDPKRPHIVLMSPADTPVKKDNLAKARAAQQAKRQFEKRLKDRQRLLDQGIAVAEVDRILPMLSPAGGVTEPRDAEPAATQLTSQQVGQVPPVPHSTPVAPPPPPAPAPAAAPVSPPPAPAAAGERPEPPLDPQLWLSSE